MIAKYDIPVPERNVTLTMTESEAKRLRALMSWNVTIPNAMRSVNFPWSVKELMDSVHDALPSDQR